MNNWNSLKPESRIWMYGANRPFSESETTTITQLLNQFCETWAAHGAKLNCGFQLLYNQFIILAVDEDSAAASGCSIDTSVDVVRKIDQTFNLDLFNRMRSYWFVDLPKTAVTTLAVDDVKALLHKGELDEESRMIHMQATLLNELTPNVTRPLKETWLRKYLNAGTTV